MMTHQTLSLGKYSKLFPATLNACVFVCQMVEVVDVRRRLYKTVAREEKEPNIHEVPSRYLLILTEANQ